LSGGGRQRERKERSRKSSPWSLSRERGAVLPFLIKKESKGSLYIKWRKKKKQGSVKSRKQGKLATRHESVNTTIE